MRKLSLKNLNLGEDELLQRDQMKTVLGGYGDGAASNCDYDAECSTGCLETKVVNGNTSKVCNYCCVAA